MEYFRDGVEDFNMMELVRDLPEDARIRVERSIAEISTDHTAPSTDPARLAAVRRLVAKAIAAHR